MRLSFSNFPPQLPAADRAMQNTVEHLIEPDLGMVHENQWMKTPFLMLIGGAGIGYCKPTIDRRTEETT